MSGAPWFWTVSCGLFLLGGWCVVRRKNAIGILMGVELILNAAALNFVVAARLRGDPVDGQVVSIFVILLAAAEAVVVFAASVVVYQLFHTADVDAVRDLKG